MDATHFRQRAANAREMAQSGDDLRLSRMLLDVALDLDAEAEAIEAEMLIHCAVFTWPTHARKHWNKARRADSSMPSDVAQHGAPCGYGNRPSNRTRRFVLGENRADAKALPAARLAASDRVGYGTIRPASTESLVRWAMARLH